MVVKPKILTKLPIEGKSPLIGLFYLLTVSIILPSSATVTVLNLTPKFHKEQFFDKPANLKTSKNFLLLPTPETLNQ